MLETWRRIIDAEYGNKGIRVDYVQLLNSRYRSGASNLDYLQLINLSAKTKYLTEDFIALSKMPKRYPVGYVPYHLKEREKITLSQPVVQGPKKVVSKRSLPKMTIFKPISKTLEKHTRLGVKPKRAKIYKFYGKVVNESEIPGEYSCEYYNDGSVVLDSVKKNGKTLTDLEVEDIVRPLPALPIGTKVTPTMKIKHIQQRYGNYDRYLLPSGNYLKEEHLQLLVPSLGFISCQIDVDGFVSKRSMLIGANQLNINDEWKIDKLARGAGL